MRPIDADNLLKKVDIYFDGLPIVVHHDMVEFIKNAPTVDVAEVKHGEWTIDKNDPEHDTYCSRCGFVLDDWIQGTLYSFCPNCGADMRKEYFLPKMLSRR